MTRSIQNRLHLRVHASLPCAHELISRLDMSPKMLDLHDAHVLEFACGSRWNLAMLLAQLCENPFLISDAEIADQTTRTYEHVLASRRPTPGVVRPLPSAPIREL